MRSVRHALVLAAGLAAASGLLVSSPVVAAPAPSASTTSATTVTAAESAAGCYIEFRFTANSYVRTRPVNDATYLGLAYAGDRFDYQNKSQNGFWYGRDMRAGGATGWVPAANVKTQKVCD